MKKSWFVVDNGLRVSGDGLDVELRLPWYRGLPLSDIEVGEIRVNGEVIALSALTIKINGKERPVEDLPNYFEENWYVLDSAYLHIPYKGAERNKTYEVQVTLVLYPPYIPGIPFQNRHVDAMRAN